METVREEPLSRPNFFASLHDLHDVPFQDWMNDGEVEQIESSDSLPLPFQKFVECTIKYKG